MVKENDKVIKFINWEKPKKIISVGDIISYHIIKNKIIPDIVIFDFKTRRGEVDEDAKKPLKNFFQ